MGRSRTVDRWLDPWLVVFLNLPALVVIVLCYLWIGLDEVAAIVAVAINKIPMVTAMVREGARALDPSLDAMARVFRMSPGRGCGMSCCRSWRRIRRRRPRRHRDDLEDRAGGENLGRSTGIGFKIQLYFQMFDVTMVLAYSLAFVAVMLAVETLVLQPIEARARRWRTA